MSLQRSGFRSELVIWPDRAKVARSAARYFVEAARESTTREGVFSVALAGGNTPRELYRLLATDEFRTQVDWARVRLYWGDERAVPVDHPDSNFGMTRHELLEHIPVPSANVHRMEAEQPELEAAADRYEKLLRRHVPVDSYGFPCFHLVLLGIGSDGHTASLFPRSRSLGETSRWVTTTVSPTMRNRRMTLTLPVLNAAHHVLFLVAGADKAEILHTVLRKVSDPRLPAQLVTVPRGRRMVIADEAAAALVAEEER